MEYGYSESTGKYYAKEGDGTLREVPAHLAETSTFQAVIANAGETLTKGANNVLDAIEGFGATNYSIPFTDIGLTPGIMSQGREMTQDAYNAIMPDAWNIRQNQTPDELAAMSQLEQERPMASLGGDILPYMATAPLSGGLAMQTGIGAGTGALFEGDLAGAGMGGVGAFGGGLFGRMFGKAWQAARGLAKAKPPVPKVAQVFEETGGTLLPSQRTGSEVAKNIEQGIRTGKVTGKLIEDVNDANIENTKRLATRALGLGDDLELDQAGITLADKRLGTLFDEFGDSVKTVELSSSVIDEIAAKAPGVRDLKIQALDDAIALGKKGIGKPVTVTGKQAMKIRSEINSELGLAKRASETERLVNLVKSFDDDFTSSAGIEATEQYSKLRDKYRLLLTMKKGNTLSTEGEVSTALLGNRLKSEYGSDYAGKLGELSPEMGELGANIAAAKSKLFQSGMGRSGTPEGLETMIGQFKPSNWIERQLAKSYMEGSNAPGVIEGLLSPTHRAWTQGGAATGQGVPQGLMGAVFGDN